VDWYCKVDESKIGPLNERELKELAEQGKIGRETMVWNELSARWMPLTEVAAGIGLLLPDESQDAEPEAQAEPQWQAYSLFEAEEAMQQEAPSYPAPAIAEGYCARCFKKFPTAELVRYGAEKFCADCETLYAKELKKDDAAPGLPLAGFCLRLVAKLIDYVIIAVIGTLLYATAIFLLLWTDAIFDRPAKILVMFLVYVLWFISIIGYSSFFIGAYGATPGKLALGLRVVNTDGSRVGYAKALVRCLVEMAGALPLALGYIIAAFDKEKRTLQDRICGTRVIRRAA